MFILLHISKFRFDLFHAEILTMLIWKSSNKLRLGRITVVITLCFNWRNCRWCFFCFKFTCFGEIRPFFKVSEILKSTIFCIHQISGFPYVDWSRWNLEKYLRVCTVLLNSLAYNYICQVKYTNTKSNILILEISKASSKIYSFS